MRRTYRLIVSIMLPTLLLGVLWLPSLGWAITLEEAKTQGIVGEQPNGYLGVVQPGASAEVQALVNDVNQKRRHMYEDIARRNSTKLEAVEMLAGKTAIDNTQTWKLHSESIGAVGQEVRRAIFAGESPPASAGLTRWAGSAFPASRMIS